MSAVTVGVNLSEALAAIAGARPVAREHDLVIIGIHHAVVAAAGHEALTLTGEQPAGHGVMMVYALVVGLHVVDVVHDIGHADGQPSAMVVVVARGGHQPGTGDHRGGGGVHFLEVVVLGRSIVHADVHLSGVVVKVNAGDVVGVVVIVRGLAVPLYLCACCVPSNFPLVDLVVGIVRRVDVPVVHVGIVDAACR